MIATRSQTRSTSSSSCEERKTVHPRSRSSRDEGEELLLHERVEPGGRLVEDQQLRRMEQRQDQPDLLPVAARELPQRPLHIGAETPRQFVGPAVSGDPAKACEQRDRLVPGRVLPVPEVAGQVPEAGADRHAVATAVEAEDASAAPGGVQEVEQRPDRRRLPGGVGTQEAEYLALVDGQADVLDAAVPAVELREAVGLDGRHGSHGFTSAAGFRLRTPIAMTGTQRPQRALLSDDRGEAIEVLQQPQVERLVNDGLAPREPTPGHKRGPLIRSAFHGFLCVMRCPSVSCGTSCKFACLRGSVRNGTGHFVTPIDPEMLAEMLANLNGVVSGQRTI